MGPESSKQWYMEAVDQDKVVPKSKQESDARMGSILNVRDKYKENASELEQDIATTQAAKHETALYRLMARTEDNPELVGALNEFLNALDHRSRFGDETQPLGKEHTEALTKFFSEKAEELHFITGNRPSTEKNP